MRAAAKSLGAFILRYRGVIAVALLLAAALCGGLYRIADGSEKHSYNSGAQPPATVQLTTGHTYEISVPGGHKALQKRGISTAAALCSLSRDGASPMTLTVTPLSADVRPTNAVATFVSPLSGRVHLDCGSWGAVYIDDSDDSAWDFSGLFLVLAALFLTAGVALGLSALYARTARDDHEIERGVGVGGGRHEVGGGDADDLLR